MKTILAMLTFALVAGQSLPDEVKSFFDRIVGQRAPAGLIVTATADFGSNPRPGDRVSWVVDVRNPGKAAVYQQLVVQTTTNLSALTARLDCPPSGGCTNIGPQGFSGDAWAMPITEMPPGASVTITETATVPAEGAFSVVVRSAPQPIDPVDYATLGNVVATLPGQTGESTTTTDTSNSTDQGTGPSNASNSVGPGSETESIRVTRAVAPSGAYQVGEGVTANFTFWNDGDAPQTVMVLGNDLRGLQLTDFRVCGPRCSFVVPANGSLIWSVDAVIADDPNGRAPSGFSDTVNYRVGRGDATSATASGKLGQGVLTWLVLGGAAAVAAVAAATAIGVNNARRKWWRNHISAHAYARASQATVKPVSIPDHVAVRIAYGPAGPQGPIPIERISDG